MLYLTRKIGESVVINETIEVTVVEVRGKSIKLGFTFPPDVSVLRREIHERMKEENRAAAAAGDSDIEVEIGTEDLAGLAGAGKTKDKAGS
jgi:carbon storage regulator